MWTWLAVGVSAYPVFLAGVIVVLRAARARSRAERAADAATTPPGRAVSPFDVDERAAVTAAGSGGAIGVPGDADEAGRAHPDPDEAGDERGGPPPEPPATRVRG